MIELKLDKRQTGEKIRLAIIKCEMTLDGISEKLGLTSPRVIYEWTSGNKMPCIENLLKLSQLLNLKLEDILVMRVSS